MRLARLLALVVLVSPLALLAQAWTFTPSAYPAVCTNPAVVGQWTMDYSAATNRAALENKPLYLFIVGSTWCPDCNGLETQVMGKPAFKAFMAASDAYWVWLDFPNRKATNATQYAWLCHTNTGLFTLESAEAILARNRQVEITYAAFKKYRTATTINMPTVLVLRPDGGYQGELTHYRQLTNVTAEAFIAKIGRVWTDDAWDVQDNRVPGKSDDVPSTATALTNIVEEVTRQAHTLSPSDSEDWYTFQAQPGITYTLSTEGRLLAGQTALPAGQISLHVYTATNASAVPVVSASGMLGQTQTVAWTWNQARPQTCFVKVGGTFAETAGYQLATSQARDAAPVGVRFEQSTVSLAETAASVTLTVALASPSAAEGGVRVFFSTLAPAAPVPFGKAAPNQDYVAALSNEVVWTRDEAAQQVTKQVTVTLVQDLHPLWEGDEQLTVALSDGLNSAVSPTGGVATVVLRESSKRAAGTVGFVAQGAGAEPFAAAGKPAVLVREGNSLMVWVGRSGGADGAVTARVDTVAGTALPDVHFVPQSVSVVFPHGASAPQPVTVATLASAAYETDRAFTVRVTPSGASGVTAGAGAVAVTLRDQTVAQSLKEASAAALTYSSLGAATWFVGNAGELRCSAVPAGKNTTLKTSVRGPGRLFFDWGFLPEVDPASRLVVKVGGETRTRLASQAAGGTEAFYVAKAGVQPVSWQLFADGGQSAGLALSNLVWQALQKVAAPVPAQNFVCTGSPAFLEWGAVAAADEYRVYVGDTPGDLRQVLPEGTGVITETRVNPCLECSLTEEMKHYWRVDAVMHVPGGDDVVVTGDVWPFSIKSWDGPVTALPKFEETEQLQLTAGGAYRLVAGVRYDLGPFSMFYDCGCGDSEEGAEDDPLTYGLVGQLPTGLAMRDLDGATHFVGVPTQMGEYALWVQSHATVEGEKVIGSTLPVAFEVVALQKAAGTFNGWVGAADDAKRSGSLALSVSEAGKLTGKIQADGQTFAFAKSSYDAETNGWVYVRLSAFGFKTLAGVAYSNTLDVCLSMATGQGEGTLTRYEAVRNEARQIVSGTAVVSPVTLFRNSWKEADAAALARACAGYYTVALPVVASATNTAPMGSGYLTLTVDAKGGVKTAGALADGASWSAASTLLAGEEVEDLGPAGLQTNPVVRVLVYASPAAYRSAGGVCGVLRLVTDATTGGLCVVSDEAMPLRWWNEGGTSVYGYTPDAEATGFDTVLEASGGFYDKLMNVQTWYLGRALSFGVFGGDAPAPNGYNGTDDTVSGYTLVEETPEGLRVTVLPQTLAVEKKALAYVDGQPGVIDFENSVNPNGLSLAFTRATGLLRGGFTLYYQSATPGAAYKTKACSYKGVLTPVRALGGAWSAAEGQGYYLIPDSAVYLGENGKPVTYAFNRSYSLMIQVAH